jgi:anaerobic selenocysteine-containing dehydrogenase
LQNCELTVQVITKLNRTALTPGKTAMILPCLGRSEIDRQSSGVQFISTESTMLNVQMSKGIFEPASEHLRSETWIVCQLAKAVLGDRSSVDWEAMASDYDNIRNSIEHVVPGFDDYNERIRDPGGFYLPSPPRERIFPTASGKAVFAAHPLEIIELPPGRLLLTTIRSHDQFNTTIYGLHDRYRGIEGGRTVIFMNESDIKRLGLEAGDKVDVTSHWEDGERSVRGFTVVPYKIPAACAAAYFPEANPLVPLGSNARLSHTPTSKCIIVSLSPSAV